VAAEATKQCGRAVVPPVDAPRALAECIDAERGAEVRLCVWEGGGTPLRRAIDDLAPSARRATVIVGPEGGLAASEVDGARQAGYTIVSLGTRILRTETAAVAVVAALQYALGDLGTATR
jgi:16S rRNA (uracil1498-N3)-methyltransferase